MRIKKEQTVFQLSFMPRLFPVNCYFVEEEDGLTLIDAALPYSVKGIINAAKKIGKPITRIILTHAHGDHVGALDGLKAILPHVPVHISERDARLMAGDLSLNEDEPQTSIRGGVPKSLKTRPDILLKDGERVGSLIATSVPGHTPGSMAFLDTRNHSLIAGDSFQIRGGIAVAGQIRPWFPFPALGTWNKQIALESARKIRDLNPALLAVGHGNMLKNPIELIDKAIADAQRNIEKG